MDPGRCMITPAMIFPKLTKLAPPSFLAPAAGAAARRHGHARERAGTPAPGAAPQSGATCRKHGTPNSAPADARESVLRLLPPDAVTEHTIDIPGGKLAYTATAGTLSLFDQSGERFGGDLLHRLCRQQRRGGEPPRHLRLQRRPGRGIGVSATLAWSGRGSSNFPATTPRPRACRTIRRPGSASPTWC